MKIENLFGESVDLEQKQERKTRIPYKSKYQKFKEANHYMTGSKKRCCKLCDHCLSTGMRNTKSYYKCELIGDSRGPATDIRLRDVCDKFNPSEGENNS